jgi:hypothetical protein
MMNPAIVTGVLVTDERLTFVLADGRAVACPTSWSARLVRATPAQRAARRIGGSGTHVEWPAIDEHIGVWTLLGVPEDDVLEAAGFRTPRRAVHA